MWPEPGIAEQGGSAILSKWNYEEAVSLLWLLGSHVMVVLTCIYDVACLVIAVEWSSLV